ncbi:MAG: hypothetical protein HY093_01830 [Candidatus Liptonbacteria bacterium]|nr:hypothetical protein [Candidatus Liptonbacteria bacterium]
MNEQFKEGKGQNKESLLNQKHTECVAALDEENRIMREIDNVFANTPDSEEADRILLKKYAPLLRESMDRSSEAIKAWLDAVKEASEAK